MSATTKRNGESIKISENDATISKARFVILPQGVSPIEIISTIGTPEKKEISVLAEKFVSEGIMYFKKQNSLRWQYDTPYKYLFILSGGKVLIKNESRTDKFDANTNKLFRGISEIMIGCVNGTMLTNENKFSSQYYVGQNTVVVKMTPKDKELKKMMTTVSLTFSKKDWLVQTIEMMEQGGDKTIINFTTKHVNKAISDDLFRIN